MADSISKLLIALGYDTTQLDAGAKDAITKTAQLQDQLKQQTDRSGRDITRIQASHHEENSRAAEVHGAKAGKNFAKAYSKEMIFLKTIMKKFFGEYGEIAAEGLGMFAKFGKTKFAAATLPTVGGTVTGQVIGQVAGQQGGKFFESAIASAVGLKVAQLKSSDIKSAANTLIKGGFLTRRTGVDVDINKMSLEQVQNLPVSMQQRALDVLRGQRDLFARRALVQQELPFLTQYPASLGNIRKPAPSALARFFTPSPLVTGGGTGMGQLAPIIGRGGMFGLAGLGAGALSLGASALAGLGLGVAGIGAIGSIRDKQRKEQIEGFKTEDIVKEINAIKDPVARTKKILDEFGKDGQQKFREMEESVKKFRKELGKGEEARQFGDTMSMTWMVIKEKAKGFFDFIAAGFSKVGNISAKLFGQGVTKELSDALMEGEAEIARLEKKLDKKRADKVAEREHLMKVEEKRLEGERAEMTPDELLRSYKQEDFWLALKLNNLKKEKGSKEEIYRLELARMDLLKEINSIEKKITEDSKNASNELAIAKRKELGIKQQLNEAGNAAYDYEEAIAKAGKGTAAAAEATKKLADEETKIISLKKQLIDNLDKEQVLRRKIADAKAAMQDRFKATPTDFVDSEGKWKFRPMDLRTPAERQKDKFMMGDKWRYQSPAEANLRRAWEIEAAEKQAKWFNLQGRPDIAMQRQNYADNLRKGFDALKSTERNPQQKALEEMKDLQSELNKLAKETGIKVNPAMGY